MWVRSTVRVGTSILRSGRGLSTHASLSTPDFVRPESGVSFPYTVSVVGAPTAWGQPLGGADLAPAALRAAGLRASVTDQGWRLVDRGDAVIPKPSWGDPVSEGRNSFAIGRGSQDGHFVLTLGGDHSIAAGSIAGVLAARPEAGVVWVDAHADINAPGTSPSGNLHGTPLSFLLRLLHASSEAPRALAGWEWLARVPPLLPSRLAYIGLRDLDPGEKAAIVSLGLRAFTMADVDRLGIGRVVEAALEHLAGTADAAAGSSLGGGLRPLHLSFDIDAVDPALAPATGTPVPGGLTLREAHYIAETVAGTGLLGSMDLVEINPRLPLGGGEPGGGTAGAAAAAATVQLGLGLVASALGRSILPHHHSSSSSAAAPPQTGGAARGSPLSPA